MNKHVKIYTYAKMQASEDLGKHRLHFRKPRTLLNETLYEA